MTAFDDNGVAHIGPEPEGQGGLMELAAPPRFNIQTNMLELAIMHPVHGLLALAFPAPAVQLWAAEITVALIRTAAGEGPLQSPSKIIVPQLRPPRDIKGH